MSDAVNNLDWSSAADGVDDVADEDDEDLLDDDELFDELLDELDDEEDDDGLELDVAATLFFLPSSRVRRKAAIAMISTATTPTMIHFALFDPPGGAPGGGPPGVAGGMGGAGGTVGIAEVGGVVGGSAAEMGWVAGSRKSGCCSGGYHLPSDACHQPSPCPVSLMGRTVGNSR
jgi:hypothetical protein